MTSEMFNLSWNDFEKCVRDSFKELLNHEDFVDVTLVTEDNRKIQCHKVIISASSPVLKSILENYPHQHPLIYLSGIKYQEMKSLINFMYLGQAQVAQEELSTFMNTATKFQIQGLSNYEEAKPDTFVDQSIEVYENDDIKSESFTDEYIIPNTSTLEQTGDSFYQVDAFSLHQDSSMAPSSNNLEKGPGEFRCGRCEYKSKFRGNVRAHIKAQHDGIKYPCDVCTYRASYLQDLSKHKRVKHPVV